MADKSFGVKELNLLNASGTPTVTSPNNLNLNANTVAISTSCTIGNNLTVTSTTNSANLNVTGIGTLTRGFATDLSVSGISTISQPSNANPHSLWDVVNNGSSAYRFTGPGQSGDENNPNIYLVRGQRYIFKVNASGHPFQLRVANGGAAYSDGVTNNGAQSGNVVINVQHDAPAQLYYQCTNHGGMVGNIYIVGGPQVISGIVTATTFVGNLTGNVTGTASGNAVLTGSTNDQLVTVTGANAITGESGLTYNGTTLSVVGNLNQTGSGNIVHYINTGNNSGDNSTIAFGDTADADAGHINYDHGTNAFQIRTNGASNSVVITNEGEMQLSGDANPVLSVNRGGSNTTNINIKYNGSTRAQMSAASAAFEISAVGSSTPIKLFTNGSERLQIGTSGQIGLSGANYGSSGQVLTSQGASAAVAWASLAVGKFASYAVVADGNNQGNQNGGDFNSGAWRTRILDTEITDSDGIVSLSSNQFTLGAGNYFIIAWASALQVNGHQARLRDVTNGATRAHGSSEYSSNNDYVTTKSWIYTRITPSSTTAYELQHRCQTSVSGVGFGNGSGDQWSQESNGDTYCMVIILKEV